MLILQMLNAMYHVLHYAETHYVSCGEGRISFITRTGGGGGGGRTGGGGSLK